MWGGVGEGVRRTSSAISRPGGRTAFFCRFNNTYIWLSKKSSGEGRVGRGRARATHLCITRVVEGARRTPWSGANFDFDDCSPRGLWQNNCPEVKFSSRMTGPSQRIENLHVVVPRLVGVVGAVARAQQQLTAAPRSPPSGVRRRASRRRRHDRVAVAPPVVAKSTAAAPRSCPAAGRVGSCPPPRPRRPMSSDCCPMRRRAAAPLPARGTGLGWRPTPA